MKASTAEQIAQYLVDHPWSTTAAIARAVDRSPATIRRYLRYYRDRNRLWRRPRWVSQFGYTWEYRLDEDVPCLACGCIYVMATVGGTKGVCNRCGFAWLFEKTIPRLEAWD